MRTVLQTHVDQLISEEGFSFNTKPDVMKHDTLLTLTYYLLLFITFTLKLVPRC